MASLRSGSGKKPQKPQGRSTRHGFVFPEEKTLFLPESLRLTLTKPIAPVLAGDDITKSILRLNSKVKVVSVGDMVTLTLFKLGICPDVCIVDYQTKRSGKSATLKHKIKNCSKEQTTVIKVKNPPGVITHNLWCAISAALNGKRRVRIEVAGEEDLASLAAISLAPDTTAVIYGIPDRGVTIVRINRKTRQFADGVLARMALR